MIVHSTLSGRVHNLFTISSLTSGFLYVIIFMENKERGKRQ